MTKFDERLISDQKRLCRGEQYLHARKILRLRDEVHNRQWRVLITAGMSPDGEINSIRELMPRAHITAVDRDQDCLLRAIEAGVDETVLFDLGNLRRPKTGQACPGAVFDGVPQFDIVHFDLCAGVNRLTRDIAGSHYRLVSSGGVFILGFSYGRDVNELFVEKLDETAKDDLAPLNQSGAPREILGRLAWLFPNKMLVNIASVISYRGAHMPMCSVLIRRGSPVKKVSFLKVCPGDFELSVTVPDVGLLYDCPKDRIEALRRKHAAIKASYTRAQSRDIERQQDGGTLL